MNRHHRHIKPKKKTIFLFFFLLLIIIIIVVRVLKPRNHYEKYKLNGYQVTIKYQAKNKLYDIKVSKNNITYVYKRKNVKYSKRIITKLNKVEDDTTTCIKPKGKLNLEAFCISNNELINPNLINIELQAKLKYQVNNEETAKYQKIITYNLLKKDYYIWNYHGFTYINNKKSKDIRLFKNDTYNASLITKLNEYLVVANYDQDYNFNKFIVYDMKKHKDRELKFNKDISYNSEFLGNNKKSIYLLDKKYEREIEIVPEYLKARVLKTPVYLDGSLKNTKIKKLTNNEVKWNNDYLIDYYLKDQKLYMTYDHKTSILVTNTNVDKIISQSDLGVYYLASDTLYYYDVNTLETKVLSYSEWLFNPNIMVVIY